MTNHHKKTDVQHDVPPPGVAPNVSYGSRECEKQTLLTTMVVLWWCCGGAVAALWPSTRRTKEDWKAHCVFPDYRPGPSPYFSSEKLVNSEVFEV